MEILRRLAARGLTNAWLVLALCCFLAACRRAEPSSKGSAGTAAAGSALVVFADTSLREAFTALGGDFERANPGATVTFNFANSEELRAQLENGAGADVFASADKAQMNALSVAHRVFRSKAFARNETVVVVSGASVATIRKLADLPSAARLVLCAPEVPMGRYTSEVLGKASLMFGEDFASRVEGKVISRELDSRQVLAKVSSGDADAGIVYQSDVNPPPAGVSVVPIPAGFTVFAEYQIAVVQKASHETLAESWIAFVASPQGQTSLRAHGFLAPNP